MSKKKNRLYRGDCKEALKNLIRKGRQVDLIYLDPPFKSIRRYNMVFRRRGTSAQQVAYDDMWTINDKTEQCLLEFKSTIETSDEILPFAKDFLRAWLTPLKTKGTSEQKLLIYLVYMAQRLLLMKKVLKDTGSIYLHCDPTASHYLKIIMDGIFGRENFRNEIIWGYKSGGASKRYFAKKHDIILLYTKTKSYYYKTQYYKRYLLRDAATGKEIGRDPRKDKVSYYTDPIGTYRLNLMRDVWDDIGIISPNSKTERTGLDTQKPIKLLHRIIQASCPEGGIVLDPFCGCGTTVESAIINHRRWIGVDMSPDLIKVIKARIEKYTGKIDYQVIDLSPATKHAFDQMKPFAKQDWLIRQVGGSPNERKSGDRGVDGEMTIHLGRKDGNDLWGKMIFSVKTGDQKGPQIVRDLIGAMQGADACMGGLIIEAEPTLEMEIAAQKAKSITYAYHAAMPPHFFDRVQILTAQEIIDEAVFSTPPTLNQVNVHRIQEHGQKIF